MAGPMTALRRVPWVRFWVAATWLYKHGRDRLENNLSEGERTDLWRMMRKSKGRPGNLSSRERDRFKTLVRQAITGRKR
jgi:hypothetical protein